MNWDIKINIKKANSNIENIPEQYWEESGYYFILRFAGDLNISKSCNNFLIRPYFEYFFIRIYLNKINKYQSETYKYFLKTNIYVKSIKI